MFARLLAVAALIAGTLITAPAPSAQAAAPFSAPAAVTPQASMACQVIQLGPTAMKDADIKQDGPDSRLGANNELRVKTESGKRNRALLQFELPAIPAGSVIGRATLYLWVKDVRDGNVTISAHGATNSWNEAQVTWKSRDHALSQLWAPAGGEYRGAYYLANRRSK